MTIKINGNGLIAKNTIYLYIRTLVFVLVNLFLARIILEKLGVTDYGIFILVGGIVSALGLLQSVVASAVSRFFTIELGRNDLKKLNQYFKIVIIIYIGIALFFLFLSETIGLWFLEYKISIPSNRASAAFYVFQFSVVTLLANIFTIPYNAIIISHERMSVFSLIGIAEAIVKIILVYMLTITHFDKLIFYSFSLLLIGILVLLFNYFYCRKTFSETKFSWYWNYLMFKELMSYSFWSLFGAIASVARNQGINIILGIFFNPAINAARGISYQVNEGITQLGHNFFTAVRPQITKNYAANDYESMMTLVFRSSRFGFYLLMLIAVPLILETSFILKIWLVKTPDFTVLFIRLVIITSLIDALGYPLITAINSTGKIKWYQIITGTILIMTLPISYFFLKIGYPPESTFYVAIVISLAAQFTRLNFMKYLYEFNIWIYFKKVIVVILIVCVLSIIAPIIVINIFPYGITRLLLTTLISFISAAFAIYFLGITKSERKSINKLIKKTSKKYKRC